MLVVVKFIGNVGGNIQHRATDGETKTGDGGQKVAEAKGSTLIEQHLISTLDINRVDEKQFKAVAECVDMVCAIRALLWSEGVPAVWKC